jgi:ferredoxin
VSEPVSGPALTVEANRETCIGSGVCVYTAPATFGQDDDAKVVVLDPAGDLEDLIRAAADGCPTWSITIGGKAAESC